MSLNYRNYDPLNGFDEELEEVKQQKSPKFIYNSEKDLEIYKKCCEKIYNEFKITNIDHFCDMYKKYEESKKKSQNTPTFSKKSKFWLMFTFTYLSVPKGVVRIRILLLISLTDI